MKGDKRIGNGRGSRKKESEQQSLDERHFFSPAFEEKWMKRYFAFFTAAEKKILPEAELSKLDFLLK